MTNDEFKRQGFKDLSKLCGKKCSCCDWRGKKNHKPFFRRMARSRMKQQEYKMLNSVS